MKCQKCGVNDANVSYTRILNGEKTELHLCSECAKEMNINVNLSFGFDDMFSNFFDDFSRIRSLAMPSFSGLRSLNSGFEELMEDSLFNEIPFFKDDIFFGNRRSLETSKDNLDNVLNNIQKKHKNNSKEDNNKKEKKELKNEKKVEDKKQKEIEQLKAKIQEYINTEEYEKAAILRDKIKELEK